MNDNISPEERLLRLIRKEKNPAQEAAVKFLPANKENAVLRQPVNDSVMEAMPAGPLTPILLFFLAVSFVYLVYSLIRPLIFFKDYAGLSQNQKFESIILDESPERKSYDFYLKGIGGRKIFNSPAAYESSRQKQIKPGGPQPAELIKDISLVGVISGDNPQAVIEDRKSQKTIYANKGQFVGEFKVEEIKEGRLILDYNGQKFELYL